MRIYRIFYDVLRTKQHSAYGAFRFRQERFIKINKEKINETSGTAMKCFVRVKREKQEERRLLAAACGKSRLLSIVGFIALAVCLQAATGCDRREKQKTINIEDRISDSELNEQAGKTNTNVLWFGFDLRSSPLEDARQYLPFLKYLSESTGCCFELSFTPRGASIVDSLGKGRVQFAAVGAGTYIQARIKYGVVLVARGLNAEGRAEYRSVIVVRPKSPIRTINDLRDKRFAFGDVTSTQGHLIPRIALAQRGILLKDLRSYEYTGSHRNCANAVLSGRADACGMQDTMGRELAEAGLVRIIYTSRYYPSSCIAANKNVSQDVLSKVKQALIGFDPNGRHAAGLYHWDRTEMPNGFVEAREEDYAELREWAKKLHYVHEGRPEAQP